MEQSILYNNCVNENGSYRKLNGVTETVYLLVYLSTNYFRMKLSIITINLNNKDGLKKTIESVVNQTFTDYEYIIIDGASTDGSVDVIKELTPSLMERVGERLYWISEPDKGIYNAMNKGILQAKGEYCLFLNSGDWLVDENILEKVFDLEVKEDIVYGKLYGDNTNYPDKLRFSFMFGWSLPHPASFIKRSLFDLVGLYDESNKIISDWTFFMLAIYSYDCSYRHIPLVISVFNRDGISSSSNIQLLISEERKNFFKQYFYLFIEDYSELYKLKSELITIKQSRIYKLFLLFRKVLRKNNG